MPGPRSREATSTSTAWPTDRHAAPSGSPQIIENSGVESWHTWSFPVRAAGGVTACGDATYVDNF